MAHCEIIDHSLFKQTVPQGLLFSPLVFFLPTLIKLFFSYLFHFQIICLYVLHLNRFFLNTLDVHIVNRRKSALLKAHRSEIIIIKMSYCSVDNIPSSCHVSSNGLQCCFNVCHVVSTFCCKAKLSQSPNLAFASLYF